MVASQRRRRMALVLAAIEKTRQGKRGTSPRLAALAVPEEKLAEAAYAHIVEREPGRAVALRLKVTLPPEKKSARARKAGQSRAARARAIAAKKTSLQTFVNWLMEVRQAYLALLAEDEKRIAEAYGPYANFPGTIEDLAEDLTRRAAACAAKAFSDPGAYAALSGVEKHAYARLVEAVTEAPKTRAETEDKAASAERTRAKLAREFDKLNGDPRDAIPRHEVAEIFAEALLGEDARAIIERKRKGGAVS